MLYNYHLVPPFLRFFPILSHFVASITSNEGNGENWLAGALILAFGV